jgi:hypothetical protein
VVTKLGRHRLTARASDPQRHRGLSGGWGDIRGRNGLRGAPSVRVAAANGGRYEWRRIRPLPLLPPTLAELLHDAHDADDAAIDAEVAAFLAEHTAESHPSLLGAPLAGFRQRFRRRRLPHEAAVAMLTWALKEARAGY